MKTFSKIFRILAATLAAGLLAWSCSEEKDDVYDVTIPDAYLNEGLSFSATGGTMNISISTKLKLDATTDADWVEVTLLNTTSTGTCRYQVTVDENTGSDSRTASITFEAGGTVYGVIKVNQDGSDGLIAAQTLYNVTSAAQTITVNITAGDTPDITVNDGWITLEEDTKASQSFAYVFDIATNYSSDERTGTITFTLGLLAETVTVVQAASDSQSSTLADAKTVAAKMYVGVNIGNTLEATGSETAWGNPQVTKTYVDGLKTLGFNAVRIPCAWDSHLSDASSYTIDPTWMSRVNEVVGYVLDNDMYAILNIHWDGGWLEDNISKGYDSAIDAEQKALWTQIAENFKNCDEHLLFAGCNEPGMNESISTASGVQTIMTYEQTFVDAVRATGGNNATRCLIVQGPQTDISTTVDSSVGFGLPTDTAADCLMVEVHYYDPYQFTLMEEDASWGNTFWYWGSSNYVSGSAHNATWGEEDWIQQQFGYMKSSFVDKGIPVIIGEFCAIKRTNVDNKTSHNNSRRDFNEAVVRNAKNDGCVPFYWETGTDINRLTGAAKEDYAIEGLMTGAAAGTYPY
ncbi:MAG: cellulase family glycosylhydrolase [Bacteroidales bacterium]|nr:cellulase family glycosylhydrolase [Bacteroidales bacterium]